MAVTDSAKWVVEGAVAAIDCGTNSTRLLVADRSGATLDRRMVITRLGEGVDSAGRLSDTAMSRTLEVLASYRDVMDRFGVKRVRMAATSAARDADNSEGFFSQARRILRAEPELLSGIEEANLSFRGATAHMPEGHRTGEPLVVVDIGGGSTELVTGMTGQGASAAVSLNMGCVRLTERFLGSDPPGETQLSEARRFVDSELNRVSAELGALPAGVLVVGLAGTVTTLAGLARGIARYEREKIHHVVLSRREVDEWYERLRSVDGKARLGMVGMVPGREDVIVAGVLILSAVMAFFGAGECLVSEDDILDGLVASLLGAPS